VLIFQHDHIARKLKLDQFPCTRYEWYKYIFWPVHANGGNYPSDPRATTAPYAQLATKMRAGGKPENQRGSTLYPRTTKITEELGRLLNRIELRKAPRVRLRLKYASLSAYQRTITPKLKPQYQLSTVPTTAPTSAFASLIPVSSVFTNQQQGEPTQDARTALSSVRSWSDRRNSTPTPSLDNTVPSFMRDTMITRAAELMSDMQLFATVDASPQLRSDHDNSELARDLDREDTAEPTQRRDEPADRWTVSSPATGYDHNASTYNDYNDDTSDRSYGHDIHFGLSPSALFERAHNQGSYREFEHSNDNGTQRGFAFQLDSNQDNNLSSATPSDCDNGDNYSPNGNSH